MATFLQLQDEVLNYGFDATAYRSRVKTWLNEAQRRVARELDLPVTETDQFLTIVSGQRSYNPVATTGRILYVLDTQEDRTLELVDLKDLENFGDAQGVPVYWATNAGLTALTLYPTPNFSDAGTRFRIRYTSLPTLMTNDSDTTGFHSDYDAVFKAYALSEAYLAEDDQQMYATWRQIYGVKLVEMGEDLNAPTTDGPTQVGGTWNF